ncbi:hypothetical protein D3C74_485790 [compost metagenome]
MTFAPPADSYPPAFYLLHAVTPFGSAAPQTESVVPRYIPVVLRLDAEIVPEVGQSSYC